MRRSVLERLAARARIDVSGADAMVLRAGKVQGRDRDAAEALVERQMAASRRGTEKDSGTEAGSAGRSFRPRRSPMSRMALTAP